MSMNVHQIMVDVILTPLVLTHQAAFGVNVEMATQAMAMNALVCCELLLF